MYYSTRQGDCLQLMKDIPNESIDMVLCDLPYGTTACKWDSIIPFPALWEQYERIIKPNGIIALFGAQPFTTTLINSNLKLFRYCWYWKKNNVTGALVAKIQPMRCVEDIAIFYKHKPTYNPQDMGSGSTGVAAVKNNRSFIRFELDKDYFEIAAKRISESCK